MTDERKYVQKRETIHWGSLQDKIGQSVWVCLDRGVLSIAAKLVRSRGFYKTTYAKEYSVGSYTTINDDELDVLSDYIAEFLYSVGEADNMQCDLQSSLDDIAAAILASSSSGGGGCVCTNGTSGAGSTEVPPATFVDSGGAFPDGYADVGEYKTAKCDLAQYIIDRWVRDLTGISWINLTGLTISSLLGGSGLTLVTVLVTPIPFDDLIGLAAALIAIVVALGGAQGVLAQAIDYVSNLDVCVLYNPTTAAETRQALIDDIDAQSFALLDGTTKAMLKTWATTDAVNIMYEPKGGLGNLPSGDCSGCESTCGWYLAQGTGTIVTDGSLFTVEATENPDINWEIDVRKTDECCPAGGTLELVSWTGAPDNGFGVYRWFTGDCPSQNRIVTQGAPTANIWTDVMRLSQVEGSVGGQFTMDFRITDTDGPL